MELLLLLFILPCTIWTAKYDYNFGLMENEPLLEKLCVEDQGIHKELVRLNTSTHSPELATYLDMVYTQGLYHDVAPATHIRHPVNAYWLIKKAAIYSKELVNNIRQAGQAGLADECQSLLNKTSLYTTVNEKDLQGALKGLLMILHGYSVDVELLRKGQYIHPESDVIFEASYGLDINDLFILSQTAEEEGYINTAVSLLRSAIIMAKEEDLNLDERQKWALKKKKTDIVTKHNQILKKRETYLSDKDVVNSYMLDENLQRKKKQPKFVRTGLSNQIKHPILFDYGGIFSEMERLLEGCRNFPRSSNQEKPAHQKRVQCHLLHHRDPFTRLGPFRLEVVSSKPNPHIVVLHGILEEEDVDHWVDWATPRLSRTRHTGTEAQKIPNSDKNSGKVRTIYKSVQAWHETIQWEGEKNTSGGYPGNGEYTPHHFTVFDPRAEKLSKRLERALALNVTNQWSSHKYQVTNYGLAGTCEAHIDPHGYLEGKYIRPFSSQEGLRQTGDYIGTTMGWLKDTPAGGATTFFNHGMKVTVWPTKGSVAFWFSLLNDGRRDLGTSHGGCPVAVGAKWIFNKWIFSFNNWARYPCGRTPAPSTGGDTDPFIKHRLSWPEGSHY